MPYLIMNLWKFPTLNDSSDVSARNASTDDSERLMAAACGDCHQYNFSPKVQCRYCGSPRLRTVQLSGAGQPSPGTWIFDAADAASFEKPN
jgi:uncharacterized OB-fold protein